MRKNGMFHSIEFIAKTETLSGVEEMEDDIATSFVPIDYPLV